MSSGSSDSDLSLEGDLTIDSVFHYENNVPPTPISLFPSNLCKGARKTIVIRSELDSINVLSKNAFDLLQSCRRFPTTFFTKPSQILTNQSSHWSISNTADFKNYHRASGKEIKHDLPLHRYPNIKIGRYQDPKSRTHDLSLYLVDNTRVQRHNRVSNEIIVALIIALNVAATNNSSYLHGMIRKHVEERIVVFRSAIFKKRATEIREMLLTIRSNSPKSYVALAEAQALCEKDNITYDDLQQLFDHLRGSVDDSVDYSAINTGPSSFFLSGLSDHWNDKAVVLETVRQYNEWCSNLQSFSYCNSENKKDVLSGQTPTAPSHIAGIFMFAVSCVLCDLAFLHGNIPESTFLNPTYTSISGDQAPIPLEKLRAASLTVVTFGYWEAHVAGCKILRSDGDMSSTLVACPWQSSLIDDWFRNDYSYWQQMIFDKWFYPPDVMECHVTAGSPVYISMDIAHNVSPTKPNTTLVNLLQRSKDDLAIELKFTLGKLSIYLEHFG